MSGSDADHFLEYGAQTELKHAILEKYLPAFLLILKEHRANLNYVDGFAGKGVYGQGENEEPGSPIRALRLVAASEALSSRTNLMFVERDPELAAELAKRVAEEVSKSPQLRKPTIHTGTFASFIEQLDRMINDAGGTLAPTFLFVDPCGIDGVALKSIAAIGQRERCEVFAFFNIDAVRRTCGLPKRSATIDELFGSSEAASALFEKLKSLDTAQAREEAFLQTYRDAILCACRADYFLPFRIEFGARAATSHYLIHVTKNALGYCIMKDVMWRLGHSGGTPGGLEFERVSAGQIRLLDDKADTVDEELARELRGGKNQRVGDLIFGLASRPTDRIARVYYKERLIALEGQGKIQVSDGLWPIPAEKRRRKGVTTLGDDKRVSWVGP